MIWQQKHLKVINYQLLHVYESESHLVVSSFLRPHGLYSTWNSPGQNTGVGSLSFPHEIFPTQGSSPGLPHCRWILYQLSHEGGPRILEWVAYSFSSRPSQPRSWTRVSGTAGGFFTNWAIREVHSFLVITLSFLVISCHNPGQEYTWRLLSVCYDGKLLFALFLVEMEKNVADNQWLYLSKTMLTTFRKHSIFDIAAAIRSAIWLSLEEIYFHTLRRERGQFQRISLAFPYYDKS